MIPRTYSSDDPLCRAISPPVDETPVQRAQRIKEEQEALRISEEIDKELNRERAEKKKHRPEYKILLLGPSGSGKSTTLKNFQLAFTPKALQAEAAKYTALIYLNVVASVRILRDVLDGFEAELLELPLLREYCTHLQPVIDLEHTLARWFVNSDSQPTPDSLQSHLSTGSGGGRNSYEVIGGVLKFMQSATGKMSTNESPSGARDREHARTVLAELREKIEAIVQHPVVQDLLVARNQRLEHLPGYFLNDLAQITALGFIPTDDDILRTRIQTFGVSETRFKLESDSEKGQKWVIVDVGGSRHQRAAWAPYFDDANAIIFIAPVGQFDQFLEEDRSINCLRDSFELWESIVSNKLLENADLILFLNKFDMLSQKLDAGIQFSEFVTSFKDRNNAESVGRYLQKKFLAIHKQRSTNPTRNLHCHFTSVTDKSSTIALITHFRVSIIRKHFQSTNLL